MILFTVSTFVIALSIDIHLCGLFTLMKSTNVFIPKIVGILSTVTCPVTVSIACTIIALSSETSALGRM